MNKKAEGLLKKVAAYYSEKLTEHGESPQGVDWNGEESQYLRFEQLCKIIDNRADFTLNDLGCGYGALLDYLLKNFSSFGYLGIDVSDKMIHSAKERYENKSDIRFIVSNKPDKKADYGIASGIFNVQLGHSDSEWHSYIEQSLDILNETSLKGFAFNCLTTYSDKEK